MSGNEPQGPATRAIHAGLHPERWDGAVTPPIYQTSLFVFEDCRQGAARFAGEEPGFIYSRLGNPTVGALDEVVAEMEGGAGAICTASGMAAVNAVYFTLLSAGSTAVISTPVYGPSAILLAREYGRFGVVVRQIRAARPGALEQDMPDKADILFVETPANPTLEITDIRLAAKAAKKAGALLVVDNTFCSPFLQRPLDFGADVVVHSMTKSMNGHGDVVAGAIVARDPELMARLTATVRLTGGTMDPHQAWLVLRGLRTLPLRMERSQQNASRLAEWLSGHERVERVLYPGLADHPAHHLVEQQMKGPGAVLAFEVEGGVEAGRRVLDNVHLFTLGVSLGGVESLIQHPASMTHAGVAKAERLEGGVTDGLIRVSVGCEDYEDLRRDLEKALLA